MTARRYREHRSRRLRAAHVILRKRFRLYRWWTSPAFRKVELTPVTALVITLFLFWIGRTIWQHEDERTAGAEIALQLVAALIGGPILIGRLLPSVVLEAATVKRVQFSNIIRWPLHERRRMRSAGGWLFALALALALLPNVWQEASVWSVDAAAWCGVIATCAVMLAWIGFVLPRRYTVRLPRSTPVLQPSQLVVRHARTEAIAGALSLLCVLISLILEFLRLYEIGPW